MSEQVSNLTDKITKMESVGDGMATLLGELSARIKAAGTDGDALTAIATEIDTHTGVWAKAVTDNTLAAATPTSAPTLTPTPIQQ